VQTQQVVHTARRQRWEVYFSPVKYAIPIPTRTTPILISISSQKLFPFLRKSHRNPMGMGLGRDEWGTALFTTVCPVWQGTARTPRQSYAIREKNTKRHRNNTLVVRRFEGMVNGGRAADHSFCQSNRIRFAMNQGCQEGL